MQLGKLNCEGVRVFLKEVSRGGVHRFTILNEDERELKLRAANAAIFESWRGALTMALQAREEAEVDLLLTTYYLLLPYYLLLTYYQAREEAEVEAEEKAAAASARRAEPMSPPKEWESRVESLLLKCADFTSVSRQDVVTAQLPNCPIARLPNCPIAQLPDCPIARLPITDEYTGSASLPHVSPTCPIR